MDLRFWVGVRSRDGDVVMVRVGVLFQVGVGLGLKWECFLMLPEKLRLMCVATLLLHPTPVPLQLFDPLLLLLCSLQISLLQQPAG